MSLELTAVFREAPEADTSRSSRSFRVRIGREKRLMKLAQICVKASNLCSRRIVRWRKMSPLE